MERRASLPLAYTVECITASEEFHVSPVEQNATRVPSDCNKKGHVFKVSVKERVRHATCSNTVLPLRQGGKGRKFMIFGDEKWWENDGSKGPGTFPIAYG